MVCNEHGPLNPCEKCYVLSLNRQLNPLVPMSPARPREPTWNRQHKLDHIPRHYTVARKPPFAKQLGRIKCLVLQLPPPFKRPLGTLQQLDAPINGGQVAYFAHARGDNGEHAGFEPRTKCKPTGYLKLDRALALKNDAPTPDRYASHM